MVGQDLMEKYKGGFAFSCIKIVRSCPTLGDFEKRSKFFLSKIFSVKKFIRSSPTIGDFEKRSDPRSDPQIQRIPNFESLDLFSRSLKVGLDLIKFLTAKV